MRWSLGTKASKNTVSQVTEACLHEYQFDPDPMFLMSAH